MNYFNILSAIALVVCLSSFSMAQPTMVDPSLGVRPVINGLTTPAGMVFLGQNDFLVIEKNTGIVQRVVNGAASPALDLAVNSASERGMLGIALHPGFPANPGVYLYWTESSTGADSAVLAETPLLGNRVDRYVWNGASLVFERNLIHLRALQSSFPLPDGNTEGEAGNHDGGKIAFGPDSKLYVVIGDVGRRGKTQNLPNGPFGPDRDDDQFGGPEPDDAHLTGAVLRLNDDGTIPGDNPFFNAAAEIFGQEGANLQKIFAYGIRNSFGMAFDPISGDLWISENGDDAFDEINRVERGMNGGWIQTMGPVQRIADFKSIETQPPPGSLQQKRWPPANIVATPEQALSRLFQLPGSHYKDPEFSWKFAAPPAAIGFVATPALGPQFQGCLLVGAATDQTEGGYLFRFNLTPDRKRFVFESALLQDRVADNSAKNDITESESLLVGRNFGVVTDIKTAPNGNLFVVSLSQGTVFEIFRK